MCPPYQNAFGCTQCIEGFFGDPYGFNGDIISCQNCNCNIDGVQSICCNKTGYCK